MSFRLIRRAGKTHVFPLHRPSDQINKSISVCSHRRPAQTYLAIWLQKCISLCLECPSRVCTSDWFNDGDGGDYIVYDEGGIYRLKRLHEISCNRRFAWGLGQVSSFSSLEGAFRRRTTHSSSREPAQGEETEELICIFSPVRYTRFRPLLCVPRNSSSGFLISSASASSSAETHMLSQIKRCNCAWV